MSDPAANPPAKPGALQKLASPIPLAICTVVFAALLFLAQNYLIEIFTTESTDDAFIAAHIVSVAPRVPGQVSAVYVLDNQLVHSNDLLVEIDPTDYQTTLAQKEAAQKSSEATFNASVAGYQMAGVTSPPPRPPPIVTGRADADAATATNAQANFNRAKNLIRQLVISPQEFDQFKETAGAAMANLASARQKAASDESKVGRRPRRTPGRQGRVRCRLRPTQSVQNLRSSRPTSICPTRKFSRPCDGRVTRKQVEVGDYLQTGQMILSLVPTEVWVVANFKENQLGKMKPGQRVTSGNRCIGHGPFAATWTASRPEAARRSVCCRRRMRREIL